MASTFIKLPLSGGGGGGGAVTSFNGRVGAVVSVSGDYSATLVSNSPAGNISSTTVQGAINELDSDVQALQATDISLQAQINNKQDLDAELTAIAAISSNGFISRTGAGTAAARTFTSGSNINITNGDGVSGNPTIALSGTIPISNGGTGVTTVPSIGALLIGTGTGYSVAQLIAGTGISVTNGSGTITIVNTNAANQNIDGGNASSVYGGTSPINGGNA